MTREIAIAAVEAAIEYAESGLLSDHALSVKGMTTPKVKKFLNSIGAAVQTYFEVGLYRGATFISAIEGNHNLDAIGVDNWSQFGGPKGEFFANLSDRNPGAKASVHDLNCFSQEMRDELGKHAPIEAMFYDGDHSYKSQYRAVRMFSQIMAPVAILIVDDWNKWGRKPTLEGIKDTGLELVKLWELDEGWWEGVGVLVLARK